MLAPGSILHDRYKIVRVLGRGPHGFVYEAVDERLSSTTAIKEVNLTNQRALKVFEREARIQAFLFHRAIPKVQDFFVEGEGQYLVMDFIPGKSLLDLLYERGTAFAVDQVANWTDQLLDLLEYVHKQEPPIILRDIEPDNLKLAGRNTIVLMDYGFAQRIEEQSANIVPEDPDEVRGFTPTFAAPEQLMGKGLDARSDLYSLAATMYCLITGSLPPDALMRLQASSSGAPDPLLRADQVNAQASSLAKVLMQAMALDPNERPASAAEMRDLLQEATAEPKPKSETSQMITSEPQRPAPQVPEQDLQIDTLAAFVRPDGDSIPRAISRLEPGTILQGRYQVVEQLGEGGMGRVYLVRHQILGNKLVLKENLFADPSERFLALFNQEATLLANLKHPQLPQVHDFFIEDGRSFFVMDFIEGHSMQTTITQQAGPFEEEEVIDVAIKVCEVLDYLHNQRPPIIHCDIKPNNIVITPQGTVKLLDLGIARVFRETSSDDAPIAYTPGFASPEQWTGRINPRTDIFSLGATMYYLLTKKMVREDNDNLSFLRTPPLRSINPRVGHALDDIINKCLRQNEDDRWQTVKELRQALEGIVTSRKYQNVLDARKVQELRETRESVREAIHKRFLEPATGSPASTGRHESESLARPDYDVFISYRRENGASEARLIRAELLRQQNIRAFLDVDDLGAGHFDEALLKRIKDIPNFILVLSPNCLQRCADERDWLRQEIVQALSTNRKVIPVILPGFQFPEAQSLPAPLRSLSSHQGVYYSHEYFDAMIGKVIRYLRQD